MMNAVTLMFEFLALSSIILQWIPLQLCSLTLRRFLSTQCSHSSFLVLPPIFCWSWRHNKKLQVTIWPTPLREEWIYLSEAYIHYCVILCFQYIIEQFAAGTFFCFSLHLHTQPFANGRKKKRLRWRGRRNCTKWILLWMAADKGWVWFWMHHKQRSLPI